MIAKHARDVTLDPSTPQPISPDQRSAAPDSVGMVLNAERASYPTVCVA